MADNPEKPIDGGAVDSKLGAKWHRIKETVHHRLLSVLDLHEASQVPLERLRRECSEKIRR
ncbi:MAG: hypothetical protein ACYSSI_11310 [Planctomycetota bacterium]|jgi:hypothetical protein